MLQFRMLRLNWGRGVGVNLPLSLAGHINLLKIKKFSPKFTFTVFLQLPLPPVGFQISFYLNQLFMTFLWGSQPLRYKSLLPWLLQGRLAMLTCQKYFLATNLAMAHWWLQPEISNASTMLEAVILHPLGAHCFLMCQKHNAPYPLNKNGTSFGVLSSNLPFSFYESNHSSLMFMPFPFVMVGPNIKLRP